MLFAVTITTIFLTVNHLSSTFASPIIESKGSIARSLNVTHSLARRAGIPPDQKCAKDTDWVGRICLTSVDDRTWEDSCVDDNLVRYSRRASCLPTEVCMNQINIPDEILAVCLERPMSDLQYISNRQVERGFMGYRLIKSVYDVAKIQHTVSVKVPNDVNVASVAAFLEGTNGNYLIAPNKALVGSLRGVTEKACDYNETHRDCVPTHRYGDLQAGNWLDFTFGLTRGQAARFYYAVIGGSQQ